MMTVAYLANLFPSAVEPYVGDEIEELRRRGVEVIAGSVRRPEPRGQLSHAADYDADLVVLQPVSISLAVRAAWLCLRRWRRIADLLQRVIFQGRETFVQRGKALLHTWLGACYAVRLQKRGVRHIHVHHGYFGAFVAMVAARLLNVSYSMTLHGSDLLTGAAYLDTKLKNCRFCVTISEYNRRYILEHYSTIEAERVVVARLGVDVPEPGRCSAAGLRSEISGPSVLRSSVVRPSTERSAGNSRFDSQLHLLAVGRLHAVKDHAFLLRACTQLGLRGLDFQCEIAGEGPERRNLERLIQEYGLQERVRLLGHVPRARHDLLYQSADVVVLTSRSEGIPVVLMEAMARGKVVVAPAITGIPELVVAGQTGFLYEPGCIEDFVERILWLHATASARGFAGNSPGVPGAGHLDWVGQGASEQVRLHFNREKNLEGFGNLFLERVFPQLVFSERMVSEGVVPKQIAEAACEVR